MLHTKFQASECSSSREEGFEVYFIFEAKTAPPLQDHFRPKDQLLNKLDQIIIHSKYQRPEPFGKSM